MTDTTVDLFTHVAPSMRTALEERGGWRNAVTWKDGYGIMHVAVEECPSSWAQARRALTHRFGHEWPGGYAPKLRTVQSDGRIREYVEIIGGAA